MVNSVGGGFLNQLSDNYDEAANLEGALKEIAEILNNSAGKTPDAIIAELKKAGVLDLLGNIQQKFPGLDSSLLTKIQNDVKTTLEGYQYETSNFSGHVHSASGTPMNLYTMLTSDNSNVTVGPTSSNGMFNGTLNANAVGLPPESLIDEIMLNYQLGNDGIPSLPKQPYTCIINGQKVTITWTWSRDPGNYFYKSPIFTITMPSNNPILGGGSVSSASGTSGLDQWLN